MFPWCLVSFFMGKETILGQERRIASLAYELDLMFFLSICWRFEVGWLGYTAELGLSNV